MYRESLLLFAADMLTHIVQPKESVGILPDSVVIPEDPNPGLPAQQYLELLANEFFDAPREGESDEFWGAEKTSFSPKRIVKGIANRIKRIRHNEEKAVDPLLQTALWEHESTVEQVGGVDSKAVFRIGAKRRETAQHLPERTRPARTALVKAAAVVLALTLAAGPVGGAFADKSSEKQDASTEQPTGRNTETIFSKAIHGLSIVLPRSLQQTDSGDPVHSEAERLRNRYGVIPDRRVVQ